MTETKVDPKFLSPEDILSADDMQPVEVEVPEWGGKILLRPMTGEESLQLVGQGKDSAIQVLALTAIKEDGSRLFTDKKQIERLRGKSFRAILRVQAAAMKLNGLAKDEKDAAKNA